MKNAISPRKLRLESLEERQLLAVVTGTEQFYDSAATPAATEGDWVVNTADDPTTWPEEDDGILSLREAISRAESGDRITIQVKTITLSGGSLSISKGITIDGKGVTINANSASRVFEISDGVELIGLTITGSSTTGISAGGTVTLKDCTVTGNNGRGISTSGTLTMTNCTVTGNTGGGISGGGSLTLTDCTVTGNTSSGSGGGIYASGMLKLTNCKVTENKSNDEGGGIYHDDGTLTLIDCTVTGNTAKNYGGGFFSEDGTVTLTDCTVTENKARVGGGGCFYSYSGTLTLTNCTIKGNTSNDGAGGIETACNTLTLTDCTVTENTGLLGGINVTGTSTLSNCKITGNTGNSSGGIYSYGTLTLTDCTITENIAKGGDNYASRGGGIYFYESGTLTLTNCTVSGNTANSGGGIYSCRTATLTNCTVMKNTSNDKGGGIYFYSGTLTLTDCNVAENKSYDDGGGIYIVGTQDTMVLTNCTVKGNSSEHDGGGIYTYGYSPFFEQTLTNCSIVGNTAINDGGGIYIYRGASKLVNCTVAGNTASTGGGFYSYLESEKKDLYNTIIAENTAVSSKDIYYNNRDSFVHYAYNTIYAHNTLSSFTDWTSGSSDNLTYDPTKPLFTDAANGVYTLAEFSQAIDKGNDEYIKGYDTDLAGATRIIGDAVDIGAYEYQGPTGGGEGGDGGEGGGDNGEGGEGGTETADIIDKIVVANMIEDEHVMSGQKASLTVYLKDEYSQKNGYKLKETNWYISDYDGGFICTALQETIYESPNQRVDQLVFTPEKGAHGKKSLTCSIVLEHRNSDGVVDSTLTDEISGTFEIFFDTLGNDGVDGQDSDEDNWLYYWANDGAITGLSLDVGGNIHFKDCQTIKSMSDNGTTFGICRDNEKGGLILISGMSLYAWKPVGGRLFNGKYETWGTAAEWIDAVAQCLAHEYRHFLTHKTWYEEASRIEFGSEYAISPFMRGVYATANQYKLTSDQEYEFIKYNAPITGKDYKDRERFVDPVDIEDYTFDCLTDTYGLGLIFSRAGGLLTGDYLYYGDDELQSRRAEINEKPNVKPDKDWSDSGLIAMSTHMIQVINKDGSETSSISSPASTIGDSYTESDVETTTSDSQIIKGNHVFRAISANSINVTAESTTDADKNGYFDSLQITASVNVIENGNYTIAWDVLDSEDNYIDLHDEEITLEAGTTELFLNILGTRLSNAASGSLSTTFYLFNNDNLTAEFTNYTTQTYDYSLFSPCILLSNFATTSSDTNNNGFYDSLTVSFTAELACNSSYLCAVNLTDADGNLIDSTTITDVQGVGGHSLNATFSGLKIHQSHMDGPYHLSIIFLNESTRESDYSAENVYQTTSYSYNDFEGAQASFSGTITENAVDTDGDGRHNTLTISVGLDVAAAGTYSVTGYLKDESGSSSIDYDTRTVYLEAGTQTVDLAFDDAQIFSAQKNGPYLLSSLILSDANYGTIEYLRNPYTTQSYDYTGSDPADTRFTGEFSDEAVNTHGTELYDALVITIGIDAETSGDYRIVGKLLDENGNLIYEFGQDESLRAGTQNIEVTVPGSAIVAYPGYTGTYRLTGLQILDSDSNLVADGPEYTTAEYSSDDFGDVSLTLTGDITDYLDEDRDYLNVSFTAVAASTGSYHASARILDADGNEICSATATPDLEAGTPTEITLRFDYQKIVEHGVSGPFYVKDFSLCKTGDSEEYDSLYISDFHETAAYSLDANVPEWNLADYDYTNYKLDAAADSNYTATLYGQETNGTWTLLQSWNSIGADAEATITGDPRRAENLTITGGAMDSLGKIIFSGGNGHRDAIWIYGTDEEDIFTIDSKVVTTTTPIYVTNPYAELLEHYKTVFGEGSKTYQNIAKCYDKAFEKLSKLVKTTRSTVNIVGLEGGAEVNFDGVQNAGIFSVGGDDTFRIKALSAAYKLAAGSGTDTLDFSAQKRVVIDMGASYAQYAVPGQAGSIRLNDDFENLFGTPGNDHVTGSGSGINFSGNGGSDTVILKGGTNTVSLSGKNQSVIATGNGIYTVNLQNGDYSCINAAGAGTGAAVNLNADGRNITLLGGRGEVYADIAGKYATVNASASRSAEVAVTGNYATILTGTGADQIDVAGDYANVYAGNGDDLITAAGAHSNIFGGNGNDIITVSDNGVSGGENRIYGEAGNDFISAANVSGRNFFYGGIGNDVVVGGSGNDTIYGTSGNNILIGLGGADLIFGAGGRDLLVANRGANMTGFEMMDREQLMGFYDDIAEAWIADGDMEAAIELLGAESLADGVRDKVYRGSGKSNLFYTNGLDNDFENALEKKPFFDTLIDS